MANNINREGFKRLTELENNTIAAAIDKVHGMTTKTEDDA